MNATKTSDPPPASVRRSGSTAQLHQHQPCKRQFNAQELVEQIEEASLRLRGRVIRTGTIRLPWLDNSNWEVWAKLECHQHTGSFKYRGALNAVEKSATDSVITASAGNHALAICRAAATLSKKAHIIAPSNVSELKSKRILTEADSVTFYGRDLREATIEAMNQADASHKSNEHGSGSGMHYISPYDAIDVAAGAGTMMAEVLEDAGEFDRVLVPLGGGGLASAVAAWCSIHSPETKVTCTHPKIFGRAFSSGEAISPYLAKPTESTLCDGLAVELAQQTPFAAILDSYISEVIQVSEPDVSKAIAQAMRFQSLLVEGSAATTIAAVNSLSGCVNGKRARVLLLLTGANISSSNIARALVADVSEESQRQGMGLRNISAPTDRFGSLARLLVQPNGVEPVAMNSEKELAPWNNSTSTSAIKTLSSRLLSHFAVFTRQEKQKRRLYEQLSLEHDKWCRRVSDDLAHFTQNLLLEFNRDIQNEHGESIPYWIAEERYRTLLQIYAATVNLNERASAANDQAVRIWFQDTRQQSQTACNYDRYGGSNIREVELAILRTLHAASTSSITALLTSSGMAAYQVIQQFILQQLNYGDTIVMPPYIYFEASEQLQRFDKVFCLHYAQSFHHEDIICAAEKHDAQVVFMDPMANVAGLPTTDLRTFGQKVSNRPGWEKRWVVIDGSVISGGIPVFDWFQGSHAPILLYSESLSKYAQMGLDIQMAGVVLCHGRFDAPLRKIRRDIGAILYPRNVSLMPPLDHELHQTRMQRLSWNAQRFHHLVKEKTSHLVHVGYPTNWHKLGWRYGGALVTLDFKNRGLNNREGLDACIELVLSSARRASLPITKGVSFGFSTSRISASSSMAEGSDPFLRLSIGIDEEHVASLASIVVQAVCQYCQTYSR